MANQTWANSCKSLLNEGMNGPFYNVTVARSYKDRDGVWKNSESFGLADLDALVAVAQQAKLWVTERSER